jgi:hypothetical protein
LQFKRNKTAEAMISVFLALTIAFTLVALPTANAHDPPWEIPSWAYISASPAVVGVNQDVSIVMWVNLFPPTAVGAYGDRWDGYTVEVTKPDGSKDILGPYTSDPVGSHFEIYTPTQVGEYKFVFKFPGDTVTGLPVPPGGYYFGTGVYIGDKYLASESDPVYVTVQQEPIEDYQETPLPEGYWTRPIYGTNRGWSQIAGNWLSGAHNPGFINPYSTGPESAHIMWTRPYWDGGVMGGNTGDIGYYTGMSYETFGLFPPIIVNGRLYYNVMTPPRAGWYCVDLQTGEELFFHNTTGPIAGQSNNYPISGRDFDFSGALVGETLNFGQVLDIELPNQHGGFPYLWSTGQMGSVWGGTGASTTWDMFDAFTGNYICSIANVSMAGTNVYGKDGSILYYNIVNLGTTTSPQYYLQVWNTTQAIWYRTQWTGNQFWMWRPYWNQTFDGRYGFSLNVSIAATSLPGRILEVVEDDHIIGGTSGTHNSTYVEKGTLWCLSLKRGQEGTLLWKRDFTPPQSTVEDIKYVSLPGIFNYGYMSGPTVDSANGVFLFEESMSRKRWCFDLETMQQLWESEPEDQWNYYGMTKSIYKGKLLSYGYSGILIAYDIRTGDVLWNWTSGTVGFQGYYQNTPLSLACIADDKIYLYSTEHSPSMPLRRDAQLWCVDTETGQLLWKIQCWANNPAIADGYIVTLDSFDNRIYCYGKGPSATTVAASPEVSVHGSSVLIKGTVTDQCAGAKDLAQELGYVNGVPAMSDADQEAWMEYLYQQQAIPTNATGVEVSLDTLDPNGNFVHIGTATSDMSGTFSYAWTPEVPGKYTVIATFAGSASYGSSYAETAINVENAPTSTTPATETTIQESPMLTYLLAAAIVIIILAVVAIVLLLRRK